MSDLVSQASAENLDFATFLDNNDSYTFFCSFQGGTHLLHTGLTGTNVMDVHLLVFRERFQGRWFVVGLAGNAVQKERQSRFTMYSTIYELQEDNSYNVTSILVRGQGCRYWIRTFVPSSRPGQFTLGNIHSYPQIQSYDVQVADTDYDQFAMVFFQKTSENKQYFKVTLYGRTKGLSDELKERFVSFAKSLGLKDNNIVFSVPTDQCIDN